MRWSWVAALVAGLVLRAVFVWKHPRFVGDTLVYADLAQNMLAKHVYGLTEEGRARATLIRLPGYPLFLAACFLVFGVENYLAVVWVQVIVDLVGCWLLGLVARQMFGERVGLICLWTAALCPFTANYAAAALTETLSIFCVVVAFWGLVRWVGAVRSGLRGLRFAGVTGLGLCGAVLLRPDGVLLAAAVLPAMGWVAGLGGQYQQRVPCGGINQDSRAKELPARAAGAGATPPFREAKRGAIRLQEWAGVGVALGLLVGCLGGWTLRNWRVFHVVQPLAPKYANDPGEAAPLGFARWYRTWGVGLGDTARVYWEYDGSLLSMGDLPPWAFDSAAQRADTARVYAEYNAESASTPKIEGEFAQLAEERVRTNPVRFYVLLPLARLGDMWLRPRTELMGRHSPLNWWDTRVRPRAAVFAWGYGLLNLGLLGLAVAGLVRWRRMGWGGWGVAAAVMMGFVVLRSGLLMTIDNSEPRYVLECYPVVVLLAAVGANGWGITALTNGRSGD